MVTDSKQPIKKPPVTKSLSNTKPTDAQLQAMAQAKQQVPITGQFASLELIRKRELEIREFITRGLLVKGVDYGTIPGVAKNMLFAAGIEMLNLHYKIIVDPPEIDDKGSDFEKGIFRFHIVVKGYQYATYPDGSMIMPPERLYVGFGAATCSSYESKYRYRWSYSYQLPDAIKNRAINPETNKFDPEILRDIWVRENGEASFRFKTSVKGNYPQWRLPNMDPHDIENTVLKQGITRANRALTLNVTGARRVFITDQEAEELGMAEIDDGDFVEGEFVEMANVETGEIKSKPVSTPTSSSAIVKPAPIKAETKLPKVEPKQPTPAPKSEPKPEEIAHAGKMCPRHAGQEFKETPLRGGGTVWAHKIPGVTNATGGPLWCTEEVARKWYLEQVKAQADKEEIQEPIDDFDSVNVKDITEFTAVFDAICEKLEYSEVDVVKFLAERYPTSGTDPKKLPVAVRVPVLKELNTILKNK